MYREKSKFVREKWKMTFSFNVQFNGSAINLLVSRDEAILGPNHLQPTCCFARPDAIGYSQVANYLRQ
jgi:hypothetical protein